MATQARDDIRVAITGEDRFSATFASFRRQVQQGDQLVQGFSSRIGALGLSLGSIGAGLTFTAAVSTIRNMTDEIDKLNDVADATGDSVENISALEDVARRNGGSIDLVSTAITKLNSALKDGKEDSPTSRALRAIGLSARELREKAPSEAVLEIAKALGDFEDDGNKARLVSELFGKSVGEIAPFLKDLAEAGELNAKVTTKQAQEAERFNKTIFALQTNVNNAARDITSGIVPALNAFFDRLNGVQSKTEEFGKLGQALLVPLETVAVLGANVAYVFNGIGREIGGIAAQAGALATGDFAAVAAIRESMVQDAIKARSEVDALSARLLGVRTPPPVAETAAAGANPASPPGPTPPKKRVRDIWGDPDKPGAKRVSEAQRYLEALQKQGEKAQELTTYEQALRDIQQGRVDGINAKLKEQILTEAQRVDVLKAANAEKEKEAAFQKLISDALARDNARTASLLDDTTGGRAERAAADIARIREALNKPENQNADFATRALEAIERIKAGLEEVPEAGKTAFDKLTDIIEKSMDKSTDAVLDFLSGTNADPGDLFKAFKRDILRALIEEPVRETMNQVKKYVLEAIKGDGAGGSGFGKVLGDILGAIFGGSGGSGARANGGRVQPGNLYRINENGIETFVPDEPGTILSAGRTRALGASGGMHVTYAPVMHVNGDVSPQTVQLMQAMLARNNEALVRSMRTGGRYAVA